MPELNSFSILRIDSSAEREHSMTRKLSDEAQRRLPVQGMSVGNQLMEVSV